MIPGPKQRDLVRDGRYAMHAFPYEGDESGLFLAGRARLLADPQLRRVLSDQFVAERRPLVVPGPKPDDPLFELRIERCLLTTSTGHDDPSPRKQVWYATAAGS